MPSPFVLKRGDILCTRGRSWLAEAIRHNEAGSRAKYPAVVNHVALVTVGGGLEQARIVEADKHVREVRLVETHLRDVVFAYRPTNIPLDVLDRIVWRVERQRGRAYNYLGFFTQQLDHGLFGGAVVMRRLSGLLPWRQCGDLVTESFHVHNYDFGKAWFAANPHDVMRYCATEAWRDEPPRRHYEVVLPGIVPAEWLEQSS